MHLASAAALILMVGPSVAQNGDTPAHQHGVPLFMSASNPTRQGFVRIINHSSHAGEVAIEAYDDEGLQRSLTISLDAEQTVHFNSDDLEHGNAGKGLTGSAGSGQGDWRLVLLSGLDIEVLSYIRTNDGFLTAMHDTVPVVNGLHDVAIFNPGSNRNQESLLRLSNPGDAAAEVSISGVDDDGTPSDKVRATVPAGASRTYTAAELESGTGVVLDGSLGDGAGKWRLTVESAREIIAMSLLSSPTGHLTNLSTSPAENDSDGIRRVSLFPAASDPDGRQGFARVINRSDTAGSVSIQAFDDTDTEYDTLTLSIGANEAKHFNSEDLELGNAGKGLAGSTGAGVGDWRLELASDLDTEVLSYMRTPDGFLTAMHDSVPLEGVRHRVAVFNPGSNANQESRLRLVNAGDVAADVSIEGIDDAGERSADRVWLTVAPGTSRSLTARELEAGGDSFDGMLGDGSGKWRLDVESAQPITVLSLLSSPTGHLTNLSTAPAEDFAPPGDAALRDRFRGGWIVARAPESRVEFLADGRFRMTEGTSSREGGYTYTRAGRNEASVVLDFDDGDRCTYAIDFASRMAGSHSYTCDNGDSGESTWHADPFGAVEDEPPPFDLDVDNQDPVGIAHADGRLYVPDSVDRKVYVYTTDGDRLDAADFGLDANNVDATGIAHADGKLYVVDDEDAKVYAYRVSGDRDGRSDFDLDQDNDRPEGMTFADGRFHVVDDFGDVFAYLPGGERDADRDFELDPSHLFPAGIAYADGRFYVVDWLDGIVYAYRPSGDRAEAFDFALDPDASFAAGIAHDGRWFFVVDEILDRVWVYSGEGRRPERDAPDLTVLLAESRRTVSPESVFTLAAAVVNKVEHAGAATVVSFYMSEDDSITSEDTELSSREVDELAAEESRWYEVELTAPSDPGAYYYGACVDAVDAETDTANNCSSSLTVTVSATVPAVRSIELRDIDGDYLERYNGIAYLQGNLYALDPSGVGAAIQRDVHGYAASGERRADLDFDLDADNADPERLVHADGEFYVIDEEDGRVYAYHPNGGRAMGRDFALDAEHTDPDGITYADGMFYVVDERLYPDRILAYTTTGERAPEADFDLHDDNGGAVGVAHANGRLFVVDVFDHKVFAYTTAGERVPDLDFGLHGGNASPRGMAYGDGSFFVTDFEAVFVYTFESGAGVTAPDLAVDVPSAARRMGAGRALTLRATILNRGDEASPATSLHYYRSADSTIDTADSEIGSVAVAGLESSSSTEHPLEIAVPAERGTYYYGACVDPVDGERATGNNCSAGMRVVVETSGGPDLVVESPGGRREAWVRYSFGLEASVRNQGDGDAGETTLRYYRSPDAAITTDDAEVAATTVDGLAPGLSSGHPVRLPAPRESGTYYFGACVDAVADEPETGNNCSNGIAVTVSARVEGCAFDLDTDNDRATGVAHANGTLYVPNGGYLRKVFGYATSGVRDADSDFELDADSGSPGRIASADDLLYVLDRTDHKVYAYAFSGERDAGADFDLATDGRDNAGIAFADDRFYLPDDDLERVLAYTLSGDRHAEADISLGAYNSRPVGITHAAGRFFVVDELDRKVYAYLTFGERDSGLDFDLHRANEYPAGIAHDGTHFHVVDSAGQIFVYPDRADAAQAEPCFGEGMATTRTIPENTPPGINVGDPVTATGGETLRYSLAGADAESFDIVAATGQIRTREGVVYDYETKNRYSVEVAVAYDDDTLDVIDVTIDLIDLVASCGFGDFDLSTTAGDGRLTLRWNPLPNREGYAQIQGYETEIRQGDTGTWDDRRTFIGRSIGGAVYDGLDNGTDYQVRVRSINAERECGWTTPVSGTPTGDLAPKDDREHRDRFGPHRIGSAHRSYRLLTPGRCRHTLGEASLYANCTYQRTAPDAATISLEFDDPSKGSCDINLAYSSLTAGSFVDGCFDAGVSTEVSFDRSFRMWVETPDGVPDDDARAPRTQEEFDVLAWGRDDLIPGFGFGCPPAFQTCEFGSGRGYTIGRDPETGLPLWTLGKYSYESTGPSSGKLVFRGDAGGGFEIIVEFEPGGSVRATISDPDGTASEWPGMPHLDLALGAQTVLLPIPPSWSTAIAVEADHSNIEALPITDRLLDRFFPDFATLVGDSASGLDYRNRGVRPVGRNRAVLSIEFPRREIRVFDGLPAPQRARRLELNGSKWFFDLTFTSEDAANYVLTITRDGHLPVVVEGFVDFTGDGIDLDEFPEELQLPDEGPQAAGEDVAEVEVAAAASVDSIGTNDLQTMLASASGADFEPGDWLEPKDGGNQRMMIVATSEAASSTSTPQPDAVHAHQASAVAKRAGPATYVRSQFELPAAIKIKATAPSQTGSDAHFVRITVVCMQIDRDLPTRGARFFSKAKAAETAVQLCQRDCVLEGGDNIQGCVWRCD
ncbi:MAG: hypothetical protein F4Y41_11765 [Gammaproteobacteria bacterium]|nr:hypothetical protein [Gammaproteobacteria bacterium]